jgi:hypothetical protein
LNKVIKQFVPVEKEVGTRVAGGQEDGGAMAKCDIG